MYLFVCLLKRNDASEESLLGVVVGFKPPMWKGEPSPEDKAFLIVLVPAPVKCLQNKKIVSCEENYLNDSFRVVRSLHLLQDTLRRKTFPALITRSFPELARATSPALQTRLIV